LLEKVQKAEIDLVQNRHRNSSSKTVRIEALIKKNSQLLEKLHKAKSDLVQNRHWNCFSEALK